MHFKPFDPKGAVRSYFTSMPHWRQEGCTYFVTYRLADSIPSAVLKEWNHQKRMWVKTRVSSITNRTYEWHELFPQLSDQQKYEFMKHFNRKLNAYLDAGHGSCVLKDPRCGEVVLKVWEYYHERRYHLGDCVVMPNHVHLLLTPFPENGLESVLQSRKRKSSQDINKLLGRTGPLWQKHSYDHIVRDAEELLAFQRYIAGNPEKAKLPVGAYRLRSVDWQPTVREGEG